MTSNVGKRASIVLKMSREKAQVKRLRRDKKFKKRLKMILFAAIKVILSLCGKNWVNGFCV